MMISVSAMLCMFRKTKFCDRKAEESIRYKIAQYEDYQQVDEEYLDRAARGYLREITWNSKQFAFINSHLSFYALMQAEDLGIKHAGWDRHHGILRPVFKFKEQACPTTPASF